MDEAEFQNVVWFINEAIERSAQRKRETIQVGLLRKRPSLDTMNRLKEKYGEEWSIFTKKFGHDIKMIILCIRRKND